MANISSDTKLHVTHSGFAYGYLTAPEVHFLDAAVARLIPADELGPGAREAGVTYFIDQQLCSAWGTHSRAYRMGPWQAGTPQQGYQLPLTPQEIYRVAIREISLYCSRQYAGRGFHLLSTEQQDQLLHSMENGEIELESLPAAVFFKLLLRNTIEGFFADPIHGGNHDKIGWKLIGFPGVASTSYPTHMLRHNVPYRVEPVSIVDIRENRASVDAQGYAQHISLGQAEPWEKEE
ncbi:MAG: Gluconate 2-dehydrogenase subunit 3 [Nitrosomonadaceae bacterium]|nr:Gluconate 2-dehydrogenase subunit 3 [Nitrosomonadaceae bacterium]